MFTFRRLFATVAPVFVAVALGTGTAGAQSRPDSTGTAVAASGVYDLKSTQPLMGMSEFPVICTVTKGVSGAYGGSCGNDQGGAPIGAVTVNGNVVTMTGDSPAGPFKAVVTIVGTVVTGTLELGSETAKIKGTFAPK